MKSTIHLIAFEFFNMTGEEIARLNQESLNYYRLSWGLPPYTIKTKSNTLIESESFFQFFTDPNCLGEDQKKRRTPFF